MSDTADIPIPRAPGLGRRVRRSFIMSLVNTIVSRLGVFLLGVLLARLLVPEEFGVYATALLVQGIFQSLTEVGSAAAIVRREGDVRPLLPTAWTMSIVWSVLIGGVVIVIAPAIAAVFGSPAATDLVRFLGVTVVASGVAQVPAALLARELRQTARLVIDTAGMVVNVGITAVLALKDFGAWSLAIGNAAGTLLVVVLLMVYARSWPRFGFVPAHAREIAHSGLALSGSLVLVMVLLATPQMVTGTVLGGVAMGYLYIAYNVANWPASIAAATLDRVALATFSRVRDSGGDVQDVASRVIALVIGVVLTSAISLAVLSHALVIFLYGDMWAPAVPALAGLALASVARAFAELAFIVLVALGWGSGAAAPQLIWLVVLVPATVVGAKGWGLAGVGWAQAAVALLIAIPLHVWYLTRVGIRLLALIRDFALPGGIALATTGALLVVTSANERPLPTLAVGGFVSALAVGIIVALLQRRAVTTASAPASMNG